VVHPVDRSKDGDAGSRTDAMARELAAARPAVPSGLARTVELAIVAHHVTGTPLPHVGRYQVRRVLGQGGMGTVFEAWDPQLARAVALKLLRPGGANDVELQQEARALARLAEPTVVTVYDLGVEQDQWFVCMAIIEGGDTENWLRERGSVSLRRVLEWFADAAHGLAAAHRAGIVHRDFKLQNMLIGRDGRAIITDFGLARFVATPETLPRGATGPQSRSTETSLPAGTPGYVAPEVLAGAAAGPASDQWSYFTALTRALGYVDEPIPARLRGWITRGLADDPLARFPDMDAVEAAVRSLLAPDSGAAHHHRELLLRRVRVMWIEGVRDRAIAAVGRRLALETVSAPEFGPTVGSAPPAIRDARALAHDLHDLRLGVLLVAPPGAGKTIRLLDVAEELVEVAEHDADAPPPVVLNVASYRRHGGDVTSWLEDELVAKYALPRPEVEGWVRSGALILLFDGLDELDLRSRLEFLRGLDRLRLTYPAPYMLTCREDDAFLTPLAFPVDAALRLLPPSDTDLEQVLVQALSPLGTDSSGRGPAAATRDAALIAVLRSPLLLGLFVEQQAATAATGASQGREAEPLTTIHERLYRAAIDRALERMGPSDGVGIDTELTRIAWLAAATERLGVTELWLEQLPVQILPSAAARAITWTLALAIAVGGAYLVTIPAAWLGGQATAMGVVWGSASATAAFAINRGVRIEPMEAMRWSWPKFRRWAPGIVTLGAAAGLASASVSGELGADLVLGTTSGVLGVSMIGLTASGRARRLRPNEGMRESARNASLVAPLVALLMFIGISTVAVPLARAVATPEAMIRTIEQPGLAWGLTMGVAAGYATWLATGMWAPIAHGVLRLMLALTTPLPLDLVRWLDGWSRRDVLRRVGGGWIFRHHTMRAWLATLATPAPAAWRSADVAEPRQPSSFTIRK
jgi:hypothetical protein